ncbi:MAG: carboxylating nicotinate-nucleotide diphosphorylase [Candidatus Dormibacteria bacterium]
MSRAPSPGTAQVEWPLPLTIDYLVAKVAEALDEDAARDDITTHALVREELSGQAQLRSHSAGLVAGLIVVEEVYRQLDLRVELRVEVPDGGTIAPGEVVGELRGPLAPLLQGERVALNFLQQLSGVASLTRRFVDAAHPIPIFDTRKTVPGLRPLQRYAVLAGGGHNHRFDLAQAVLIKDNHIALVGGVEEAVRRARATGLEVEVEVESLDQLREALAAGADLVLLDNMTPPEVAAAVRQTAGRARLEVSGGIRLDTVAAYAAVGIDRIAVGALTHSAPALDISMDMVRTWR